MENEKNYSREKCDPVSESELESVSGGGDSSFDIPDHIRKNPALLVNYLNQRPDILEKLHHDSGFEQGVTEVTYH